MVKHRTYLLVLTVILAGCVVAACTQKASEGASPTPPEPTAAVVEQPTELPPPKSPPPPAKCGDGICDQAEQDDPELCPRDCPPDTPEPTDTPPRPEGTPDHPCGDGVCDGPENAQNCPEDCGEATPPPPADAPVSASGAPDYEPPINVYFVLHIDPIMEQGGATFKVEPVMYTRTRNELDWLMEEAQRHRLHFTALFNGWYPEWALENDDTAHLRALVDAGHDIGSHAHRLTYDPTQDLWLNRVDEVDRYGRPNYDFGITRQCWSDAHQYVDEALDVVGVSGQNQTMCAYPFMCSDEGQLMREFGFSIASGNRSEKAANYFGHIVWNPWRPGPSDQPGFELQEDLRAGYIAVDHLAQIGSSESHGTDLTVPQLQRRFLMLYAEWLSRERSGADDRVWVFGFCHHPNYSDRYNAEIVEFLSWLDEHFIGKRSPYGNIIAHYATSSDIGEQYVAWEAEHPGVSSFSYGRGDPYPYTYPVIPTMLEGAAYESHVDLRQGVSCFRFSKDGRPIYLLWSDAGEQVVNLAEVDGRVRVTSGSGEESVADAAALPLTEEPVIVETL